MCESALLLQFDEQMTGIGTLLRLNNDLGLHFAYRIKAIEIDHYATK
jgi:hypothetical protein